MGLGSLRNNLFCFYLHITHCPNIFASGVVIKSGWKLKWKSFCSRNTTQLNSFIYWYKTIFQNKCFLDIRHQDCDKVFLFFFSTKKKVNKQTYILKVFWWRLRIFTSLNRMNYSWAVSNIHYIFKQYIFLSSSFIYVVSYFIYLFILETGSLFVIFSPVLVLDY